MNKKVVLAGFLISVSLAGAYIINDYYETEVRNEQIKRQMEDVKSAAKPPPPQIKKQKDGVDLDLPEKLSAPDMTLEIVGVLKLQINENNSWETIAKLLVLLLFSYGGVKYINKRFA